MNFYKSSEASPPLVHAHRAMMCFTAGREVVSDGALGQAQLDRIARSMCRRPLNSVVVRQAVMDVKASVPARYESPAGSYRNGSLSRALLVL